MKFLPIFQDILKFCQYPFLKDILVMTLVAAFSVLLAKVRFNYKQNRYSVNCYDDNFDTTMSIIEVVIEHSLAVISMMPKKTLIEKDFLVQAKHGEYEKTDRLKRYMLNFKKHYSRKVK